MFCLEIGLARWMGFRREEAYGPWAQDYIAEELASLLGRKVDLIERARIERMDNWIKRRHILQTAVPVYVDWRRHCI